MQVAIDGRVAIENLEVDGEAGERVALLSAWGGYGWSQTNYADDVYDGVFEKVSVTDDRGTVLYEDVLHGWDAVRRRTTQVWDAVIDWFVTYL